MNAPDSIEYLLTRDRFVAQVRLRHIIETLTCISRGYSSTTYEGDATQGFFAYNGNTSHHRVLWNAEALVALVFHSKFATEAFTGIDQVEHFDGVPQDLADLCSEIVTRPHAESTGALWVMGEHCLNRHPPFDYWGGMSELNGYTLSLHDALFSTASTDVNWTSMLSDEQVQLVMSLATSEPGRVLTLEEEAILLRTKREPRMLHPRTIVGVADALMQLGIAWTPLPDQLRRALPGPERALPPSVRDGRQYVPRLIGPRATRTRFTAQ